MARLEVFERGLHRRHHLPSGVLHQDDARNADVFYRAAVGFAHLRAGENAHAGFGRIVGERRGSSVAGHGRAESSTEDPHGLAMAGYIRARDA